MSALISHSPDFYLALPFGGSLIFLGHMLIDDRKMCMNVLRDEGVILCQKIKEAQP